MSPAFIHDSLRAAQDAYLAWRITPQRYTRQTLVPNGYGGWSVAVSERYGAKRRLHLKSIQAHLTFRRSMRVRRADAVVIRRLASEGLGANLLHVLEVLNRAKIGAPVFVDWTLTGEETGFKYGSIGENVWPALFLPISDYKPSIAFQAEAMMELPFWGTGREYLRAMDNYLLRERYYPALQRLTVVNGRIVSEVARVLRWHLKGRLSIGVHYRVPNPMVLNSQLSGRLPPLAEVLRYTTEVAQRLGEEDWAVYLATDDSYAVEFFRHSLGKRLVVRGDVQRTTPAREEVHFGHGEL